MANENFFELHPAPLLSQAPQENADLHWQPEQESRKEPPIRITGKDDFFWARMDPDRGTLEPAQGPEEATVGFRMVSRRISTDLVMVTSEDHVLVNGVPALKLAVLGPRDSVMLGSNRMFYVTKRVRPHVGLPTQDMLEEKCPFCRIPISENIPVVTCSCGAIYHNEPPEENDLHASTNPPLGCFQRVNNCLKCGRELSLQEYLVWNPEAL